MPLGETVRAKWAFTARRVRREDAVALDDDLAAARAGELILARVDAVGSHRRLQLADGAYADLWEGDLVVAACGDRYASDQFEGRAAIAPDGCDLLAGGGVVGRIEVRHQRMAAATRLVPLGRLADGDGAVLTLDRYARPRPAAGRPETVIAVVGSAMNAGKTTAAAALIRGLTAAGVATAGIKATGTGAFCDVHCYEAAGAVYAADFTEDGLASTYRQPIARIVEALDALVGHAAAAGCEAAVVEIADGLLQPETAALLSDASVAARFDGFLFAAGDALAAIGGLALLEGFGLRALAVTGRLTRAPLAVRETAAATDAWIVGRDGLADPAAATALRAAARTAGLGGEIEIAA